MSINSIKVMELISKGCTTEELEQCLESLTPLPTVPRITKSTSAAAIVAKFKTNAALLKRYEVAKGQANLWDGERDGIREAVRLIPSGQYEDVVITRTSTAAVCYPNTSGKFQLEECLQCSVPMPNLEAGMQIMVFHGDMGTPEKLLDMILHVMQTGKDQAINALNEIFIGTGEIVDNMTLYKKEDGEKMSITILPEAPVDK